MSGPSSPACFADSALQCTADVALNEQIARDTFVIRLEAPEVARRIVPGQFIMVRLPGADDPLLARPLALYDTALGSDGGPHAIDVGYLVVGKLTSRLARLRPKEQVELWGPLGNGFAPSQASHLIMVAGGIGQTPFLALAREALGQRTYGTGKRAASKVRRVTLCYGVRSVDYLAGLPDFEQLGVEVHIATDDGSAGHKGFVTELLPALLDDRAGVEVVCCGPEKMMEKVAAITRAHNVRCHVSLETPMACGIGICFSCVARVDDGHGGWDYRRTCVEGPVFDAQHIHW